MNYPRIFERVYTRPVAIAPSRFRGIHSVLLPRLMGEKPLMEGGDIAALRARLDERGKSAAVAPARRGALPVAPGGYPAKTPFGKRVKMLAPAERDPRLYCFGAPGVAHLPISGVLCKNPDSFEETCGGAMDVTPIQEALNQALDDPEVTCILMDLDTPGGEITNIPETAQAIRAASAQKPVYAFTDAMCCSAGYWLACAAKEFFATPSADIGSIGVYCALLDQSLWMENEGLKLEFFFRGARKGIGVPGRDLNDDDRAYLQAGVDEAYADFTGTVKAFRPQVSPDCFEAQVYSGTQAAVNKLVDGTVPNYDAVAAALAAMYPVGA